MVFDDDVLAPRILDWLLLRSNLQQHCVGVEGCMITTYPSEIKNASKVEVRL